MNRASLLSLLLLSCLTTPLIAVELSGNINSEFRYFANPPLNPQQHNENFALSAKLEMAKEWDNGYQLILFTPYLRLDQGDSERTQFDIRELIWSKAANEWELRVGIGQLFWGVSESQHLVDIINQTDLVAEPDGDEKLGQPMINLALIRDWGTVDLLLLPYFRERTFAGKNGRLRPAILVEQNNPRYESSRKQYHRDIALRWSHYKGDWDFGLSYFNGTSREPDFLLNGQQLQPYYRQIEQLGIDLQATKEGWLWKLEAIQRRNREGHYNAATLGFEYSFYGVYESSTDVGLVVEYLYDSRDNSAPSAFQNDLMLGLRFALNDTQSSEALIGTLTDIENGSIIYSVEASRRLGDNWKATLEGRIFQNIATTDPLYSYRQDDYLQLQLGYYF